jgi:hypothetical protein
MAKQQQRYHLQQGYFPSGDPQPERPAERPRRQRRPFPVRVILVAVLVIALVVGGILIVPRLIPQPVSWSSDDLVGSWRSDAAGGNAMTAAVTGSQIEIYWDTESGRALYWAGSFRVPEGTESTKQVVSVADPRNATAIMASSEAQKPMTVTRSEIRFEVTALGVTRQMILRPAR